MAQSQEPTKEGYGEAVRLLCGEETVADNAYKSVVCYEGTCTAAAETSTYATPAATKSTKSGVSIADADSVASVATTVTDDTVQVDHEFTAGETVTVTGFGVCNDANDKLYAECCFNAGIALEDTDKLTVQMKVLYQKDSG